MQYMDKKKKDKIKTIEQKWIRNQKKKNRMRKQ